MRRRNRSVARLSLRKYSAGFSMLELAISVGILGSIILAFSSSLSFMALQQKSLANLEALEEARWDIRTRLDCQRTMTFALSREEPSSYISLLDHTGRTIWSVEGQRYGPYVARGRLRSGNVETEFRLASALDDEVWRPLFSTRTTLC